jgi:hypothetical protein
MGERREGTERVCSVHEWECGRRGREGGRERERILLQHRRIANGAEYAVVCLDEHPLFKLVHPLQTLDSAREEEDSKGD